MSGKLDEVTRGTNRGKGLLHIFSGRASRREYWLWCGPLLPAILVLSAVAPILGTVLSIALLIPTIRRLHDLGRSGWWIAGFNASTNAMAMLGAGVEGDAGAVLAIIAGVIYLGGLIALGCVPGQPEGNAYGPSSRRKQDLSETFR